MSFPDWALHIPWDLVSQLSNEYKLDRKFVGAMVRVESDGIAATTRFEPTYRWLYFPERYAESLMITEITETNAQKTSFGLLQCLGAVARELGFTDYLSRLSEPRLGLDFGCRKLAELKSKCGGDLESMAAGYNAGSIAKLETGMFFNQKYVDELFRYYRELS